MSADKLEVPKSLFFQEGYKNVMILSKNVKLTVPQLSLLNRGLNFIPTRGSNRHIRPQSRLDLQCYHRRLKLLSYFGDDDQTVKQPFTPASNWTPPEPNVPTHIRNLIQLDLNYFENSFRVLRMDSNLTPDENLALKELMQNKKIIIKPADKGSVVVVMDIKQYLWEGHRQLNDTRYYSKLIKPIYTETFGLITKIFQQIYQKKLINAKQRNYLIGDGEPRPRRFYLLPKIHKEPSKWSKPFEIPPGRPIVSDCSSETYRSAEFIDYFLNPLAKKHKSYIKDTYDFIEKIKSLIIPTDAFLFTIDVDSLYTNIDTQEGITTIRDILLKFPDKNRPNKELLQLLEINLTRNDFEFDGQFFLQTKGTAMGKKFAPAYADIFMAAWETAALEKCVIKPLHYFRYLDDIWGVWAASEEEFSAFLHTLNHHNASIKLKATIDINSVNFLDTTTFKGPKFRSQNQLDIKVYFKETDTHALLHRSSHHPKHTFAGLIKSQLLRFHRICTQPEDFKQATKALFSALTNRGYTRTFLRTCLKTFQQTKPIQVSTLLPFVTTYSPSTAHMVRKIKSNFDASIKINQPLNDWRIIAAFRKNRNLKDYLVKAKINSRAGHRAGPNNQYFKQLRWVYDHNKQKVFETAKQASSLSKNCVYMMTCKRCGVRYVGETGLTINVRFICHKHNVMKRKNMDRHVVKHFVMHGWDAVQALVLECNPHWSRAQRRRAERDWISRLGTLHPQGLNERIYFRT